MLNSCRRARGAGYQHGNRRGCLRGTRESVLNEIESWTKDFNKSPVFWLNGLAGTGKSTIAQTIAERVFADGLLGASFFCSRDFEDRSGLHFIFPTLAFQLAHKYPDFRDHLVSLLQSNPDIVDESLYSQMERLIVEPLRSVDLSTVIVIDALDECRDEEPSSAILSVLGRFVERIPGVKFFITGRPEPRIKTGFRLPLLVDSTNVFVLHDVHPSLINNDIRLFLKHELSELARRRRLNGWPSDEDLDILCHRASGLFVYAVASVKFLDNKVQLPKRRLEVIAGLPERTDHEGRTRLNSKTTLDSLYTSIIEAAFGEEDPEVSPKVRSTIGAIALLVNPLPPPAIAELICLDPEEVILFLTLVQSLLVFDEDSNQPVKPFHKSFPDFVTDPSRCTDARFYISPDRLHLELVTNCLKVMNDGLERNLLSLPDYTLNSEIEDLEERINNRISGALRYACQSWHNHLAKPGEDVTNVVLHLRIFLEEKFLAWLEVVSVLGDTRGAVTALERLVPWLQEVCFCLSTAYLILIHVTNQASGAEELLDTARDCFRFVTKFFEPINVSAVHIYHSALELSPLSSIIRKLYYHWRGTSFPRVVAGTPDAWDDSIHLNGEAHYHSYTWSPCGRFVAARALETVDIRDPLSSELHSTLTQPNAEYAGQLAYSPDGHSLASLSGTSLTIWDIQTGGVAKEMECVDAENVSLTWSLDGGAICAILQDRPDPDTILRLGDRDTDTDYVVRMYDVASGTTLSSGTLRSRGKPYLWAHNTSFRVITVERGDRAFTIETFEIGSVLTKVESFHVKSWGQYNLIMAHDAFEATTVGFDGQAMTGRILVVGTVHTKDKSSRIESWGKYDRIGSFSPTTYRISISNSVRVQLRILDVRESECLLEVSEGGKSFVSNSHCFSSDGNLFADSSSSGVNIWKYTSGHYTPWREFPSGVGSSFSPFPLHFSPTFSSILGRPHSLQVWRLDGPPITTHPNSRKPFAVISHCGTYVATGHQEDSIVTITSLLPPTSSQPIDTDMYVYTVTLAGSVLLVWGCHEFLNELVAWRLTEKGVVCGVSAERRAGRGDSIWTVSTPTPMFSIGCQTVITEGEEAVIHVYDTGTGEALEPTQASSHPRGRQFYLMEMMHCKHYPNYRNLDEQRIPFKYEWPVTQTAVQEGWVKDFEGKHRLWIPVEWRVDLHNSGWLRNTTLLLHPRGIPVIVML